MALQAVPFYIRISFSLALTFLFALLAPLLAAGDVHIPHRGAFIDPTSPAFSMPAPTPQSVTLNRTRRIALLHMHDGAWFFQKLGALTLQNKVRYAKRHGYELVFNVPEGTSGLWREVEAEICKTKGNEVGTVRRTDGKCYAPNNEEFAIDKRAATFGKIKLAIAACEGRKNWWLLWSDADALIVNQSIPLHSIIDDAYDLHFTEDWLMINAGVILMKCSTWTVDWLKRVYEAREFDKASALDQSAMQHFLKEDGAKGRVKYIPKWAMNVYTEEYRPGDFLVHMAGKLYEASEKGALAIAMQLETLSRADDLEYVSSFFTETALLNAFSGTCVVSEGDKKECGEKDPRRLQLKEPLGAMSTPDRYKHVGLRYHWLKGWKDQWDKKDWNNKKRTLLAEVKVKTKPKTEPAAGGAAQAEPVVGAPKAESTPDAPKVETVAGGQKASKPELPGTAAANEGDAVKDDL